MVITFSKLFKKVGNFIKMNEFTKVEAAIATNDDAINTDYCKSDVVQGVEQTNGKGFTKPAITRLARRAGVKSMSDDCIVPLKHLVAMKLDEILSTTLVVNSQHATKTIMPEDVYEALSLCGINVARTEEF